MIHSLFSTDTISYMTDWTDLTSNSLSALSPVLCVCVWSHTCREDLSGALDAALECQKRYNLLPRIHDITVALVEKGDTELLQKGYPFLYLALHALSFSHLFLIHQCSVKHLVNQHKIYWRYWLLTSVGYHTKNIKSWVFLGMWVFPEAFYVFYEKVDGREKTVQRGSDVQQRSPGWFWTGDVVVHGQHLKRLSHQDVPKAIILNANPKCQCSVCIEHACNKRQQFQECVRGPEIERFRPGSWWSTSGDHVLNGLPVRRQQLGEKVKFNALPGQVALECVKVETVQWSTSPPPSLPFHPLPHPPFPPTLVPPERWQTLRI